MTSSAAVAVVVLNWNNAEDTLDCLRSLRDSSVPLHVTVVDNGSVDDSASQIERSGLADELIRTGRNLGYAGGNNEGLRHVLGAPFRLVAVLNNDTLVPPQLFERLLRNTQEVPRAAFSPTIMYADDPGSIWFGGGIVDKGWPRHLQNHELVADARGLQLTETLTGCLLAAAPETWHAVGLFDERLFLIFEDSDWSLRARRESVALYVDRDSTLLHKVSRSFRGGPMRRLGTFYFIRNGLYFERRYAIRHLPRFLKQWVVRPTGRGMMGREPWSAPLFAWIAVMCFLVGQTGVAPAWVSNLAHRWP